MQDVIKYKTRTQIDTGTALSMYNWSVDDIVQYQNHPTADLQCKYLLRPIKSQRGNDLSPSPHQLVF